MGLIMSFYRRKKTPLEVLEHLEEEIQSLEDNRQVTLQRQKKIVGHLIIYSVVIYVIAAIVFYFCFFPASLKDRLFYIIPLLIFPVIVIIVKRLVTWYYKKEIIRSKDKLADLRAKKKKILDEVMDKETFKVAKDILEKFAPDQLSKTLPQSMVKQSPPKVSSSPPSQQPQQPPTAIVAKLPVEHETPRLSPQGTLQVGTSKIFGPPLQQRQFIRPILPPNRSYMDRLIEALVGDGINNRYALICKNCATHNGMALKEEFEYIAFRCVYCGFPNPARKRKPVSPALPSLTPSEQDTQSDQESHSEEDGAPFTMEGGIEEQIKENHSEVDNAIDEVDDKNSEKIDKSDIIKDNENDEDTVPSEFIASKKDQ